MTQSDVELAIELFDRLRIGGLQPRDAVHAATMRNNGLTRLISADKDFDTVDTVVRVDPLVYTSATP